MYCNISTETNQRREEEVADTYLHYKEAEANTNTYTIDTYTYTI